MREGGLGVWNVRKSCQIPQTGIGGKVNLGVVSFFLFSRKPTAGSPVFSLVHAACPGHCLRFSIV